MIFRPRRRHRYVRHGASRRFARAATVATSARKPVVRSDVREVYGFPSSPNCLKVRAVASELCLNLEWVTVDILEADDAHGRFQGA